MDLTQAQQEALQDIVNIMREHFEAGFVALQTETQDVEHDAAITEVRYHGGLNTAIGLARTGEYRLLQRCN